MDSYLNLGMAHGLAGILKFLVNCFHHGYDTSQLIIKILNFYRQIIKSEILYLYDKRYNENSIKNIVKATWCYGDLGVATSLDAAQKSVGLHILDDYIEYVVRKSISFNQKGKFENDFFCHGKVGCAYLLQSFGISTMTTSDISNIVMQNLKKENLKNEKKWSIINGLPSLIIPWIDFIIDEEKNVFLK